LVFEREIMKPTDYYECGICGCYHPANWNRDCRDDENRFNVEELDAMHGAAGWREVPMPS
jgi:hypothetical protein